MKKFKFKLDPVLRYRKYKERLAQIELVKAKHAVLEKEQQINNLEVKKNNTTVEMKNKEDEGVSTAIYKLYENYLFGLTTSIEYENTLLTELQQKMIERQKLLNSERIKRETLERMEEIEKVKYIQWAIKTEQKMMDEMVALKGHPEGEKV